MRKDSDMTGRSQTSHEESEAKKMAGTEKEGPKSSQMTAWEKFLTLQTIYR